MSGVRSSGQRVTGGGWTVRKEDFEKLFWGLFGVLIMAAWSLRYDAITTGGEYYLYIVNNITGGVSVCDPLGCKELEFDD